MVVGSLTLYGAVLRNMEGHVERFPGAKLDENGSFGKGTDSEESNETEDLSVSPERQGSGKPRRRPRFPVSNFRGYSDHYFVKTVNKEHGL